MMPCKSGINAKCPYQHQTDRPDFVQVEPALRNEFHAKPEIYEDRQHSAYDGHREGMGNRDGEGCEDFGLHQFLSRKVARI